MRSGLVLVSCLVLGISTALHSAQASIPVEVAASPDSNLTLIMAAVQSAQTSVLINIYELTSVPLTDLLVSKIQSGVTVQILEEGQPYGGMPSQEQPIETQLIQAMNASGNSNNRYVLMTNQGNTSIKRRFVYDHAKYMVIDSNAVFVGSENYSASGQTPAGKEGTRGWEVFIHSPQLATYFINTFNSDSNPSEPDIMNLLNSSASLTYSTSSYAYKETKKPKPGKADDPVNSLPSSGTTGDQAYSSETAEAISPIFSPDTSQAGILQVINNATSTLDIEQYSFEYLWKKSREDSPIYSAMVAAARRGVTVRVLLNDDTSGGGDADADSAFVENTDRKGKDKDKGGKTSDDSGSGSSSSSSSSAPSMNTTTMQAINQLQAQGLPIQARIANLTAMNVYYIHNKGVLADSDKTFVSSINWTENAVTANREAAVILTSPTIHSYYEGLFNQDWDKSQ
jgi:cardiolipin synthase